MLNKALPLTGMNLEVQSSWLETKVCSEKMLFEQSPALHFQKGPHQDKDVEWFSRHSLLEEEGSAEAAGPTGGRVCGLCAALSPGRPWSYVLPAAGRLGPIPGRSGGEKVPGRGDHPQPQAQVPPVQGEQEGLNNVSITRGETATLPNCPFLWLIFKNRSVHALPFEHATFAAHKCLKLPVQRSGRPRGSPAPGTLCVMETPLPYVVVRFAASPQGTQIPSQTLQLNWKQWNFLKVFLFF